jgi:hypothetical protein
MSMWYLQETKNCRYISNEAGGGGGAW